MTSIDFAKAANKALRACFQIEAVSGILVKALADGKSQPGPYFNIDLAAIYPSPRL